LPNEDLTPPEGAVGSSAKAFPQLFLQLQVSRHQVISVLDELLEFQHFLGGILEASQMGKEKVILRSRIGGDVVKRFANVCQISIHLTLVVGESGIANHGDVVSPQRGARHVARVGPLLHCRSIQKESTDNGRASPIISRSLKLSKCLNDRNMLMFIKLGLVDH
jgi:hypothetical protein